MINEVIFYPQPPQTSFFPSRQGQMAISKSEGDSQSHPKAQSYLSNVLIQLACNQCSYTQSNLFYDKAFQK